MGDYYVNTPDDNLEVGLIDLLDHFATCLGEKWFIANVVVGASHMLERHLDISPI